MSRAADTRPSPEGGWSEDIITLRDARVVPPDSTDFVQRAGVLDNGGAPVPQAALWRRHRPITTPPEPPGGALKILLGRWLWDGVLWGHFGHFLAESTARLWALEHLDEPVNGVLFIPRRPDAENELKPFHKTFFDLMGLDVPVRQATYPIRVEELVVPGQGFGLGEISAGTPRVRASRLARLGEGIAPEGGEKLYISRSELGFAKGSILGERQVETWLAEEGYEVFHPQQHSLDTQIARYKAACRIVATDGSALHLVAMTGCKNQEIAIIARRQSSAVDLLARHVASFCERSPHVLHSIDGTWFPTDRKRNRAKRLALGELNLPNIGAQLVERGFIRSTSNWRALREDEVRRTLAETGRDWEMPPWQRRQRARLRAGTQPGG